MRSDLPPAVAEAIARCSRPSLVFDLARIERNARAFAAAARAHDVRVLFAAKSFPHPEVRAVMARVFDGFDAANARELAELPASEIVSVVDPAGSAVRRPPGVERLIVGCETVDQVAAAPLDAEIAIRISASATGRDPAVGAIQDGSGHRRSRFGLDVDPVRRADALHALVRAAGTRPIGLHVHHGPVAATSGERFVATARASLAAATDAGLSPRFLDLGGAWHAIADLPTAFAQLRTAIPDLELVAEPGRALVAEAGFACGRVVVARELDDRALRVLDLSRSCHLRWSQVELVGNAPRPGSGRDVVLAGPTCFEDDVIGEWRTEEDLPVGARAIVRHVTGYAVAWNTGFHGVPPADVVIA